MWDVRNLRCFSEKQASKYAWRWENYVSFKKLQIKTNPDNATGNILKYKASTDRNVF